MSDVENDSVAANALCDSGPSPDKPALKKKCKELETELDSRAHQLNASKTAIMQLLEQVQASKDGLGDVGMQQQTPQKMLRRSTDSASSVLTASKHGRHAHSAAAHEYVQQITSRDRIIADLRARNQDLRDEAREAAAEKRRLQEQHRNDRRVREQHASMLQSVHGLKHQVEAEVAVRRQLEADMAELRAKLKHEASKNAMHRENERVLDATLATKQQLLERAHATLSELHERYSALTQVVASASQSAACVGATARGKAQAAAGVQAALEGAGDEARRLAVRTSTLVAQLAHERQSKKAAEKRAAGLEAQLAALQTAQGVAELAQRAAGAEAWHHRADAAAEQLERLRGAYQHVRQQHAELRRQLEAGALATPSPAAESPGACSDAAVRTPPRQGAYPHGGMRAPQPSPASPMVPVDNTKRSAALAAEVAAIRSRIALLRREYADDPRVADVVL